MKVLITTLVTLAVGTAMAAPSTSATLPSSGTSTTALEKVAAKKSPLSFKYEGYVEKSQGSIDKNKSDLTNENDLKITYKLSDKQSLRLLGQVVNAVEEGPNSTDTTTRLGNTYLQYAHSGLFNVASKDIDFALRNYFPSSESYKNKGQTYQTRIYFSSDFKVNERLTLTPILNPRFYGGSSKYRDGDTQSAMMVTLLEAAVSLSDRFSWTTDLARFDKNFNNNPKGKAHTTTYIESWITATLADKTAISEKIALDVGFYNENLGNGLSFSKNDPVLHYFTRLHVNF